MYKVKGSCRITDSRKWVWSLGSVRARLGLGPALGNVDHAHFRESVILRDPG